MNSTTTLASAPKTFGTFPLKGRASLDLVGVDLSNDHVRIVFAKVQGGKEVVCVVPSKLLITKNVDMPSRDRKEIDKIVDLQAGRFTPYSRNEIVIDYL